MDIGCNAALKCKETSNSMGAFELTFSTPAFTDRQIGFLFKFKEKELQDISIKLAMTYFGKIPEATYFLKRKFMKH
jgi:hypothetical protein